MTGTHPASRMVADIGGTNSRLALFDYNSGELRARVNYLNKDYSTFQSVVQHWLEHLDAPPPGDCCLAIAAPPFDDRIDMLNFNWSFSLQELAQQCGFNKVSGINDFVGNAYALPYLTSEDLHVLRATDTRPTGRLATMGPGTGLGGCSLSRTNGTWFASHAEPGHMGLAPATDFEIEVFRALPIEHREVYAEYLLSGAGLLRLYEAIAQVCSEPIRANSEEEVSQWALTGQCSLCETALKTFCALLGSVCGDFVLANGAFGGLYLGGGIIPRMIDFLEASSFLERFEQKGKMTRHLAEIPVCGIISGNAGLVGAAHAPLD